MVASNDNEQLKDAYSSYADAPLLLILCSMSGDYIITSRLDVWPHTESKIYEHGFDL